MKLLLIVNLLAFVKLHLNLLKLKSPYNILKEQVQIDYNHLFFKHKM